MAHEEIDREIQDFVAFAPDEKIQERYYVRKLEPPFQWALAILLALCTFCVATLVYWLVWKFFIFRAQGYLLLTSRRVIYFEKGRSLLRRRTYVASLDIEHVSGARLFAQNAAVKLLGLIKIKDKKQMYLNIFTEHFDAISIGAVKSIRTNLFQPAEDMVNAVHEIGARIHDLQLATGGAR